MYSQLVALFGIKDHMIINQKRERKKKYYILLLFKHQIFQCPGDKNLLCLWIKIVTEPLSFLFHSFSFLGGKNHVNDLRSDALKRIKASDNQLIMKEHLIRLENDKCQSNQGLHYDYNHSGGALKDHKPYFMEDSYYSTEQRTRSCNPYSMAAGDSVNGSIGPTNDGSTNNNQIGNNATDKQNQNASHDSYANDYDDSISMNGDNSKDYLVTSSGGSGNSDHIKTHRNIKRTKFDYLNSFDAIRPRNIDEMQNDEHQRLIDGSNNDYRVNVPNDNNQGGSSDDNGTNINVNYASSDDLNQTNTSEHDDKNLSGSDDESGGNYFLHLLFNFSMSN